MQDLIHQQRGMSLDRHASLHLTELYAKKGFYWNSQGFLELSGCGAWTYAFSVNGLVL